MNNKEQNRLENISANSKYAEGIAQMKTIEYSYNIFSRYIKNKKHWSWGRPRVL